MTRLLQDESDETKAYALYLITGSRYGLERRAQSTSHGASIPKRPNHKTQTLMNLTRLYASNLVRDSLLVLYQNATVPRFGKDQSFVGDLT